MSHYGPKWQVISNLSLTPVWTRIREPSMKADTPIFEFVICNGRGGGEQFIMGCSRSCETFQPIMDTYSSIRWSEKFVKNRERKEFLIIDLWSHIYKYRVGIKLSFNFREKYIYTHIFFFQIKMRFIARTIIAILNLSRMSISWLPSPPPSEVCSHP